MTDPGDGTARPADRPIRPAAGSIQPADVGPEAMHESPVVPGPEPGPPPPVPWEEPPRRDREPITGWSTDWSGAPPVEMGVTGWGAHVPTEPSPRSGLAIAVIGLILVAAVVLPIVGVVAFGSQLSTILSRAGDAIASSRPISDTGRPVPGYSGPIPSGRIVGPESLRSGDCFDEAPGDPPDGVRNVVVVACAELHHYEFIASLQHPAGAGEPYPGDDAVASFAIERCSTEFTRYVGRSPDRSVFEITWLQPTAEGWRTSDRRIDCLAVEDDESASRGSIRGADR
jgi:Septum formation